MLRTLNDKFGPYKSPHGSYGIATIPSELLRSYFKTYVHHVGSWYVARGFLENECKVVYKVVGLKALSVCVKLSEC